MPGIFGFAGGTQLDRMSELLARMGQSLKHYSWYVESRYVEERSGLGLGRMALGFGEGDEQPAINEEGNLLAVMDGEIYDYQDHRRLLTDRGHSFRDDSAAELLLHGFDTWGVEFFRQIHGRFVAAIWHKVRRQLVLVNDRFGMKPLYYSKIPGGIVFSSEIKGLLMHPAVSRQRNWTGIAQFFTFGQLLAQDTLWQDITILPAAGWLTYNPGNSQIQVRRYWNLASTAAGSPRHETEALDRIDQAFGRAIHRCTQGNLRLGLSLSGGMDSRTILAAIGEDKQLTTVSMGMEGSIDHRSARAMARLARVPHHHCVLDGDFLRRFPELLRAMVHLTDGHFLSQCVVQPTLPLYRELRIQALLRGHAGELMHMGKAYNFSVGADTLRLRGGRELEEWLFRRLQAFILDGTEGKLFGRTYRDAVPSLAQESLRACLRESESITPLAHRIWHLFISQRLRRETALSLVKFNSLVEPRLPFLDGELVEALLAVPPEWKVGEKLQTHILRRRRPEFLRVTNANTGTRPGRGRVLQALGKARLRVLAKLGVQGYQPYERLGLWLRTDLQPLVQHLLLSDQFFGRGIFDAQTVRRVVQNHVQGKQNHTMLLMALMIFELGQREFHDAPLRAGSSALPAPEPCPQRRPDRQPVPG